MKRRLLPVLLGLVLLLSGCGSASENTGEELFFYYVNNADTGASLQAEQDWIEEQDVPHLMERLLNGPDNLLLLKTFPNGTQLQNWSLEDGQVTLDLSEPFGRLSGIELTQAEYCIVLTLAQLSEVESVTITVDGKSLPGSAAQTRSAQDVILKGETEDPVSLVAQLYFPLSDGSGLGVEYRSFKVSSQNLTEQANAILRELALGPTEEDLVDFLTGASVLEVSEIKDGVCTVALDSTTLKCIRTPTQTSQLRRYAIVDTLTELEGIDSVTFQLNGVPIVGWATEFTPIYEFTA